MGKRLWTEDALRKLWGTGEPVKFKGRKYKVGKMSYGDYFFEPVSRKQRKETDLFDPKTLWLKKAKKYRYLYEFD
jgi:hypothetical protein